MCRGWLQGHLCDVSEPLIPGGGSILPADWFPLNGIGFPVTLAAFGSIAAAPGSKITGYIVMSKKLVVFQLDLG